MTRSRWTVTCKIVNTSHNCCDMEYKEILVIDEFMKSTAAHTKDMTCIAIIYSKEVNRLYSTTESTFVAPLRRTLIEYTRVTEASDQCFQRLEVGQDLLDTLEKTHNWERRPPKFDSFTQDNFGINGKV